MLYVSRLSARRREAVCSLSFCDWSTTWTAASKYDQAEPPGAIYTVREIVAARQTLLNRLDREARDRLVAHGQRNWSR